ncbi:MAG: hypothetical protein F7C07_05220 [Desulfurococcales archaeon]|nr:hypothetical protein [Desulfurococcales archaeon]
MTQILNAKKALLSMVSESRYALLAVRKAYHTLSSMQAPCIDLARLLAIERLLNATLDLAEEFVTSRNKGVIAINVFSLLRVAQKLAESTPPEVKQSLASLENLAGYILSLVLDSGNLNYALSEENVKSIIEEKIKQYSREAWNTIKRQCTTG